jgi:hypothetical protein
MNPDQHAAPYEMPYEMLRTAMNTIHQQHDTGLMPAELAAIDQICDQVMSFPGVHRDGREWYRAAVMTKALLRDHSQKAEWLSAYADLPPMEWRHRVQ